MPQKKKHPITFVIGSIFIFAGILLIASSIQTKSRQAHIEKIKAELNALFPKSYTLEITKSETYVTMYDVVLGLGNSDGLYDHDFYCGIAGIEAIEAIARYMTESEENIAILKLLFYGTTDKPYTASFDFVYQSADDIALALTQTGQDALPAKTYDEYVAAQKTYDEEQQRLAEEAQAKEEEQKRLAEEEEEKKKSAAHTSRMIFQNTATGP